MEMALIFGQTADNTRENGSKGNNMERESIRIKMASCSRELGTTE
jgi:hypothetical protein